MTNLGLFENLGRMKTGGGGQREREVTRGGNSVTTRSTNT